MRTCPECNEQTELEQCPTDGHRTLVRAPQSGKADALLGTIFEERYRIDALLGRGGYGAVYEATQLAIGRAVAIKILRTDLAENIKEVNRFQQEARAMATIVHPNVVVVHDFGQAEDGRLFLVTEFLEGESLRALMTREAPLDPRRLVAMAIQMLEGLGTAHRAGIVHRDLKPENLFVTSRGRRQDVIKILDFGIAKVTGDAAAEMTLTKSGSSPGSPRYMSPEQCRSLPVTPQSDLYSLGVVLHEALTGRPLFPSASVTDCLIAHVLRTPPHPRVDDLVLEGPLIDVVMSCLAKRPTARPASAEAMHTALVACRQEPVTALRVPTAPEPTAALDLSATGTVAATMQPDVGAADLVTGHSVHDSGELSSVATSRSQRGLNPLVWAMPLAILLVAAVLSGAWFALQAVTSPDGAVASADGPDHPAETQVGTRAEASEGAAAPNPADAEEPTVDGAGAEHEPPGERLVRLVSDPNGARVVRSGEPLGVTPMSVTWTGATGPELVLELDGYEPYTLQLEGEDDDTTMIVSLDPRAPDAAAAEADPVAPAGRASPRRKPNAKKKKKKWKYGLVD